MKNVVPRFHKSIKNTERYDAYRNDPTPENWQALIADLQSTISSALQSFANGDKTMRVRALILAKKAVDDYDPDNSQGASLTTHVYNNLKRLNRFREQRDSPVHYPETLRNDRRAIYKFKQDFEERTQREPAQSEIMDAMAMSRKRVEQALNMRFDVPSSEMESDKGHEMAVEESEHDARRRRLMDLVYVDQDVAGKKIMEWGMGYGGSRQLPKAEMASRLGISAPAVSQRISTILTKVEAPRVYDEPFADMYQTDDPEGVAAGYAGGIGVAAP